MSKKIAMISDFDGTISKIDFFHYVIENLLTPEHEGPWQAYKAGKKKHIVALNEVFSNLHLSAEEMYSFILSLPIEEGFVETVNYCEERGIQFYIISAGSKYYIEPLLNKLGVLNKVVLYSNEGSYNHDTGLVLISPEESNPYYSESTGIDKKKIVQDIVRQHDYSIFAGDGRPDFDAINIADVDFAKAELLKLCQEKNVPVKPLNSYFDILETLKNV